MVTSSKDGTWRVWNIDVRFHQQEDPKCLLQQPQEVPALTTACFACSTHNGMYVLVYCQMSCRRKFNASHIHTDQHYNHSVMFQLRRMHIFAALSYAAPARRVMSIAHACILRVQRCLLQVPEGSAYTCLAWSAVQARSASNVIAAACGNRIDFLHPQTGDVLDSIDHAHETTITSLEWAPRPLNTGKEYLTASGQVQQSQSCLQTCTHACFVQSIMLL